jgi:hypothetical protein
MPLSSRIWRTALARSAETFQGPYSTRDGVLYQNYVQSQQPPQNYETPEMKAAKPWSQMTAQDALDLAKTSKYGKSLDFNDPHVVAGWHESQRRCQRGE